VTHEELMKLIRYRPKYGSVQERIELFKLLLKYVSEEKQ
jgi:hypothetical protein